MLRPWALGKGMLRPGALGKSRCDFLFPFREQTMTFFAINETVVR